MDILLFAIIVLLLGYIVYSDIQNRKERDVLTLKFMSKGLDDYVTALEDTPETKSEEEDPYIPADEAGIEQIVEAKE